nr:hypothetical protein [Tanacetum cinerariifolium]
MLADELDVENTCLNKETEMLTQAEEGSREPKQDHGGLNSSWGDWNVNLSEIERGMFGDSMLIGNNYMLEHSMPILHHFADQGNFAYPTYEPPNVLPYLYPYIPYPYPYTHYPNPGNQSNQGGSNGLGGDDYVTSAMPNFRGSSSRYAVGGSLVHAVASRERCQKQDLWMISALEESPGLNLAWIISKMLADELDVENTCLNKETEMLTQAEEGSREPKQDHGGLNSSWGDWNVNLSEIERGMFGDSMLIGNNYMLEHSMPILHHFADQGNFAYPTYEPPNVLPYLYPYIPYPYPYTHYPNPGNQSNQGGSNGLGGDDYVTSAMPNFRGSSSRYAVGGSPREA